MDKSIYQGDVKYESIMTIVRDMLRTGLIDEDDYTTIDTKMKQKYKPFFGSI